MSSGVLRLARTKSRLRPSLWFENWDHHRRNRDLMGRSNWRWWPVRLGRAALIERLGSVAETAVLLIADEGEVGDASLLDHGDNLRRGLIAGLRIGIE